MHLLIAQLLVMVAAVIAGVLIADRFEAPIRDWAGRLAGQGRRRR